MALQSFGEMSGLDDVTLLTEPITLNYSVLFLSHEKPVFERVGKLFSKKTKISIIKIISE
jgi:hypothetical protein